MIKLPSDTIIKWKPASIFPKNKELLKGDFYYYRYYLGLSNYKWTSKIEDAYGPFHIEEDNLTFGVVLFVRPIHRRKDKKQYSGYWSPKHDNVEVLYYAELPEFIKADYLGAGD